MRVFVFFFVRVVRLEVGEVDAGHGREFRGRARLQAHGARFETPPPVRLLVSFGVSSPAARSASGSAPRKVRARGAPRRRRAPPGRPAWFPLRSPRTPAFASPRRTRSRREPRGAGASEAPQARFRGFSFPQGQLAFSRRGSRSPAPPRSAARSARGWGTRGSAATTAARTSAYLSSAYAALSAATVRSTEGGGASGRWRSATSCRHDPLARVGDLRPPGIARGRGRTRVGFVVHGQREQPLDDPTHRRVSPRPARHRTRARRRAQCTTWRALRELGLQVGFGGVQ